MGNPTYSSDSRNRYALIGTAATRTLLGQAQSGWSVEVLDNGVAPAATMAGGLFSKDLTGANASVPPE